MGGCNASLLEPLPKSCQSNIPTSGIEEEGKVLQKLLWAAKGECVPDTRCDIGRNIARQG